MPDLRKQFDVRAAAERGYTHELRFPDLDGEVIRDTPTHPGAPGAPWTITLRGRDSKEVSAFIASTQEKHLDRLVEQATRRRGRPGPSIAKGADAQNIDMLVIATVSWAGLEEDGTKVPFTPDNARRIYAEYPWIADQLQIVLGSREFFLEQPSGS